MRFLNNWRFTNPLQLLDIALFLAVLPILLIVHPLMVLYIFVAIFFIVKGYDFLEYPLLGFGLFCVIFSSFVMDVDNFKSLSWFVTVVINLLLVAVFVQRLNKKINFYLVISPFLFMVLALFFHNSITALIYTIVQLFIFTTLYLLHSMQKPLYEGVKMATVLFFTALPIVVVLFLFFPRISFERGEFGFGQDGSFVSGHEGAMHLGADALSVISNAKVFEVEFFDTFPQPDQLYFRGSVLYEQKEGVWVEPSHLESAGSLQEKSDFISYKITLQPHYNHHIFALDYPVSAIEDSFISREYTVVRNKSVVDKLRYEITSAMGYRLDDKGAFDTLAYDKNSNPKAAKVIQPWKSLEKKKRLKKIDKLFQQQQLLYTLDPPEFDKKNIVDSFLFDHQKGYCVHYAAAYATIARMAGIDARVVTGYLGKLENRVNEYLIVRQQDAHAWVEIFLDGVGWKRVDPTEFHVASDSQDMFVQDDRLDRIYLMLNYFKYKIDRWILHYNYLTQQTFFDNLTTDKEFLYRFISFISALVALAVIIFVLIKKATCGDEVTCLMQKLLKKLEKRGYRWDKRVSLHRFLLSINDKKLEKIDTLYLQLRFSKEVTREKKRELKRLIKEF